MQNRRVVITGLGPVSAIGVGREAFFAALHANARGLRIIDLFDTSRYRSTLAAELAGFRVEDYLESQKTYLDRGTELAFAAMSLAIADAGLELAACDRARVGLCLGTAFGSFETMRLFFEDFLKKGPRFVKPFLFPHTYANTAISLLAIEYGLTGYHNCFASGATAAAAAILDAADRIREGRCDLAFAGGFEAFNEILFALQDRLGALSPARTPRDWAGPFDAARNGCVPGEGAGVLVLESVEHARAREAVIYGELLGGALCADSGVSRGGECAGVARAMRSALVDAQTEADAVDTVLASANGSVWPDRHEARAVAEVFGARPPVTTVKPMLGETFGAGAALQLIAAAGLLNLNHVPPVNNLVRPEPGLGARFPQSGIDAPLTRVLLNAIDPGGSLASFVIRR